MKTRSSRGKEPVLGCSGALCPPAVPRHLIGKPRSAAVGTHTAQQHIRAQPGPRSCPRKRGQHCKTCIYDGCSQHLNHRYSSGCSGLASRATSLTRVSFSTKEAAGRAGTRASPGLSRPEAELSGAPNRPRDVSTCSHPTAHTLFKNPTSKHTHQLNRGVITGEDTAAGGRAG